MIDGSVNVDAIENLALSAILDAVYCLAHPTGATAPRLHIHRGQESTHGIDTHVSLDVVLAATDDIATRVRRLVAGPDAALTLRRLTRPGVVVDAGRWQVLARINGRQTPRDLAWATGAELFATLLTVDRLAVDGLCGVVPTQTSKPTPAPAPAPAPDGSNGPEDTETEGAGGTPAAVVAQRRAEASPAGVPRTVLAPPAEWADDLTADPTIDADLIQRLVTGLRALG
jgi:hypothetical protein